MHTHQEAQENVHDLNLFATVQLLKETHAVLSLGKLCEDQGYSNEWVSGQKPRLTQNGKSIISKTDNFVPLVVPGLSANSGCSASSTTLPQESLGPEAPLVSGNRAASRSSSDSVLERSDERATGRLVQEPLRSDKKDANDPLADLPCWFEEFTDNLEPTRSACTRAHFSGLRFGTSYESGNEIEEAQYFLSHPERPKLRRLLENQK